MDNRMKVQEEISNIKSRMVGSRYRHFKGGIYIVTDIAVHSETEGPMVIYKTFDQPNLVWCRPLDMFLSKVDHEKYPDVQQIMRFERIDNDSEQHVPDTNVGNIWTTADQPPKQGEYLLLSFENFSVPQVGTYREGKDGSGAYYLGDDDVSCSSDGLFVNAWMYLPEPYRE